MKRKINPQLIEEQALVPVHYEKEVTSTNEIAKRYEQDILVVTSKQTEGKGTHNRSFISPKDKGIYMSLNVSFIDPKYEKYITPLVSVITSLAIDKYISKETKIKWINDIYLNGKKICGILVEKGLLYTIGIGINLYKHKFKILNASSIENELKIKVDINHLIINIVNDLYELFNNLDDEILREYIDIYKDKSNLINRTIKFSDGSIYKVIDINDLCHLIVQNNEETKELETALEFQIIE